MPELKDLLELKINLKEFEFDYIFEIKGKKADELIPIVLKIFQEYKFQFNKGYLSVRDIEQFKLAKNIMKNGQFICLMQKNRSPKELIQKIKENDIKITQIRPQNWLEQDWNELKSLGIKMTIFYADTPINFQKYLEKNPYGLFTNYPARLKGFYLQNQFKI